MKLYEKVIVANTGDDSLTFIDFNEKGKLETLNLKDPANYREVNFAKFHGCFIGPYDLEYSSNGYIYCTNVYDNSVLKIEIKSKKVVDIIPVGKYPTCIKYFNKCLYIINSDSNSISIVDEENFSLIENIQVGEKPVDLEIDRENKKLYVANGNSYSIDVIDLKGEGRDLIKLVNNPVKIILDESQMYILSNVNNGILNSSNISILDLNNYKEKNIINLKGIFNNMIKINGSEIIFITNMDNGCLYRMDIKRNNLLSKTHLIGMPNKLGWNGKNILFISNVFTNMLTVFDIETNNVIDNIEVGKEPNGILILN